MPTTSSSKCINSRLRQLHKARQVKKAGYANTIQALSQEIKQRIDELLLQRNSPDAILKELKDKYPTAKLPSRTALYTYRTKYFNPSEVNTHQVTKQQQSIDLEKMNVKQLITQEMKQFLLLDVPHFREQMYQENDVIKKSYKTKTYLESMKLMLDMIPKLNLSITIHTEEVTQEQTTYTEDRITRILKRHGKALQSIRSLDYNY